MRQVRQQLIAAAATGNVAAVEELIQRGADVNAANEASELITVYILCLYSLSLLKLFLLFLHTGQNGETALHVAAANGRLPVVEWLVMHSGGSDVTAMNLEAAWRAAVDSNQIAVLRYILEHCWEPCTDPCSWANLDENLVEAAADGKLDLVELLIHYGADINARSLVCIYFG